MLDSSTSHKFVLDDRFKLVPQSAAVPSPHRFLAIIRTIQTESALSTRYSHVAVGSCLVLLAVALLTFGGALGLLPAAGFWVLGTLVCWVFVKLRKPRGVKLAESLTQYLELNKPRFEKDLHDSAFTLSYHFYYNGSRKRADGMIQFVAVEDMIQSGGNQITEDSMADDSVDHGSYAANGGLGGGGFRTTGKADY